ncbi:MAG: hypothetical protein BM563_10555 [Bacteroidetes bacterium MedPE-SWsnd-G1]|nr:MAG: hypothetical protein BM563_10555 [Bacteroidetes bacterium MedPE-SWsnd-G1]
MRKVIFFLLVLSVFQSYSQQLLDENIQNLIEVYAEKKEINCEITIDIEIEGMQIPQKVITVNFEEGKKPKVKGKGLALVPKKGMINQFNELFNTPLQAIKMDENGEELDYKLVSLINSSEWVTADIRFNSITNQIFESTINTRKHGTIKAKHSYKEYEYPIRSILTFDVKKFKVPLRFIGRQNQNIDLPNGDDQVQGKIVLQYRYIDE